MSGIRIVHYALAFALELLLLVAFGLYGFRAAPGPWLNILLAVVLVAIAIRLWGWFAAPKSTTRLGMPAILVFKAAIFGAGALALHLAGESGWAIAFAALSAVDLGVAWALGVV